MANSHNNAHGRGLEHENGKWFNPQTRKTTVIATPAIPEQAATDPSVITLMLAIAEPTEDDILMDLGCGDGRIVIAAAKKYGCRCVGIEIDPDMAELARENVRKDGLDELGLIRTGDILVDVLVPGATIVTMYLYPDLIRKVLPRCTGARTIISVSHQMPRVRQTKYLIGKSHVFVFEKGVK